MTTPAPRRALPATPSRASAWARTWGLALVALIAASVVGQYLPSAGSVLDEPFVRSVKLGDGAHLRTMDITVNDVEAAPSVNDGLTRANANGVFVLLSVSFTPTSRPDAPNNGEIHAADGRIFGGRQVVRDTCVLAQPGLRQSCTLVFEMPKDALVGAHFVMPTGTSVASDDLLNVDLQISDAALIRMRPENAKLSGAVFGR